jgi:signal transduction histidine kinase
LAGEVHDVVGHTLSASMLHTTAARLSIRSNPDAAIASLERAEEQGRRSLDDIRSIVRLLRDPDGPGAPTPLVSELPELVEGFRAAGVDVTFVATGPLDGLPTATALTAYRIVQEGLTNATRHGTGPINVTVRRSGGNSHLDIDIANDQAVHVSAAAEGTGLTSMRERVGAIGGTLEVGPVDGGTRWLLCARLPT